MQTFPDRWRMFVGYLAESTAYRNQRTFHVYVPELLPTLTGDITSETATHSVEVLNVMTNQMEDYNVSTATTIVAEYFGVMISRTVPTMYKNQQVLVLNYSNDDRFFWLPLERDDALRTFEQIRWSALDQAVTNKTTVVGTDIEGKQSGITDDNSYFLEIDTKYHKHILLSTSASDGESWRYFIKVDANSHSIELRDQSIADPTVPPNSIVLESQPQPGVRGRIKLENAAGTSITMEDKNMSIHVPKNLEIYVGGNLVTTVEGTTASTFVGAVGTSMMNTLTHQGLLDATFNYGKNVGIAVGANYTLTAIQNITTNTPLALIQNQTMRTVTTLGTDTLTTSASIINAATGNWTVGSVADTYVIDLPEHGSGHYPARVHAIL